MSRTFPDTLNENISLGDITSARFLDLVAWSFLAFFRITNADAEERTVISKWSQTANTDSFLLRTDRQSAPTNMEVFIRKSLRISGGDNVALNTWYLTCVTNSGGGGATDVTLYLVDMAGTFLDDGLTGDHDGDEINLTAPLIIGGREDADEMAGDIAYACYVDAVLTKAEILAYRYDPIKMAKVFEAVHGVQFNMPLLGQASPEPDWSRNGAVGTITGTVTRGNMPPVALFTPRWATVPLIEVATGGVAVLRRRYEGY